MIKLRIEHQICFSYKAKINKLFRKSYKRGLVINLQHFGTLIDKFDAQLFTSAASRALLPLSIAYYEKNALTSSILFNIDQTGLSTLCHIFTSTLKNFN